jgi:hypothetical protein
MLLTYLHLLSFIRSSFQLVFHIHHRNLTVSDNFDVPFVASGPTNVTQQQRQH